MNDNPERDRDDPGLEPDDNALDDEPFDAEDILQPEDDDFDEALPDLDEDEDLAEEVIVVPPQYAAAPRFEVPLAYVEEAEPGLEPHYADEEEAARPGPFDRPGPFAAPNSRPGRPQQTRSLPAFEGQGSGRRQVPVFTVFRPESNSGTMIGLAGVGLALLIGLALILKSFSHDPSLQQFLPLVVGSMLLCLAGLGAYWTWGSLTLRYVVDRNSLSIRWGAQRQVVPLANIERLIPAGSEGEAPDVQGVDWPGHHVGKARVQQLGEVLFYSGHRTTADILYVQTPTHTYAVSVPDPVAFAETIQTNQLRGSLFEQRQSVQRDGIAAQSFWLDPQARFLTLVLIGAFIFVVGYVLNTYPDLAQSVPLRYPALGGLLRVTDKSELLDIPRSAAAFLGLNLLLAIVLHPWERMVSIVLLLAGIAIQIALLMAAIVAVA